MRRAVLTSLFLTLLVGCADGKGLGGEGEGEGEGEGSSGEGEGEPACTTFAGSDGDPLVWSLPDFGKPKSSYADTWDLWFKTSSDYYTDGLNWSLADLTGDGAPDMVVTWRDDNVRDGDEDDGLGTTTWLVYENLGDGFSDAATVWSLPDFGEPKSSYQDYWEAWFMASYDNYTDGLNWSLQDLTGDGKPDLVVSWRDDNVRDGDEDDGLGTTTWLVYENVGDGFSDTATVWSLPDFGSPKSSYQDYWEAWFMAADHYTDGLNWSLQDLTGDGKPDLVVSWRDDNVRDGDEDDGLGTTTWLVYTNEGGGFSDTATVWSLPDFGEPKSSYQDYWEAWFMAADHYSDGLNWSLTDMNGDAQPDLVVEYRDDNVRDGDEEDALGDTTWLVYRNEGDGFSEDATPWALPDFGTPKGSYADSWDLWYKTSYDYYTDGLNWNLQDINGDGGPDIVVTYEDDNVRDPVDMDDLGNTTWAVYLSTCE